MRKGVGVWVGVVGVLCVVLVGLLVVVFWVRFAGGGLVSASPSVVESSLVVEPKKTDEELAEEYLNDKERWGGFPPSVILPRVFGNRDLFDYLYVPQEVGGFPIVPGKGQSVPSFTIFYYGKDDNSGPGFTLETSRTEIEYRIEIEGQSDVRHVGQATCSTYAKTGHEECMLVAVDSKFTITENSADDFSDVELERILQDAVAKHRAEYGS